MRTKTTKRASRVIIEKYYPRLTLDFHTNKRICGEIATIPTKRLRNKIAGYVTHLMKRIQKGPVRGISFKLQEEERERRDNYVPDVSELELESVKVDPITMEMVKSFGEVPSKLVKEEPRPVVPAGARRGGFRGGRGGAPRGGPRTGAPRPRRT